MAGLHALIESRENIRCAYLDDHLAFCTSFFTRVKATGFLLRFD